MSVSQFAGVAWLWFAAARRTVRLQNFNSKIIRREQFVAERRVERVRNIHGRRISQGRSILGAQRCVRTGSEPDLAL